MNQRLENVGFLSRAARHEAASDPLPGVGPGTYAPPSSVRKPKPSYTPFHTTASRSDLLAGKEDMPGPGVYDPPVLTLVPNPSECVRLIIALAADCSDCVRVCLGCTIVPCTV